jgi:hypothetical protein
MVVCGIMALLLIFNNITIYSVKEEESFKYLGLKDGEEVEIDGQKYSNYDEVFVSTLSEVSCKWKEKNRDDGYKNCEATFEIKDEKRENFIVDKPDVILDFKEAQDIRNLEIFYSDSYNLVKEKLVETIVLNDKNGRGVIETLITGKVVDSLEDAQRPKHKRPVVVKKEELEILKKEFNNFFIFNQTQEYSYENDFLVNNGENIENLKENITNLTIENTPLVSESLIEEIEVFDNLVESNITENQSSTENQEFFEGEFPNKSLENANKSELSILISTEDSGVEDRELTKSNIITGLVSKDKNQRKIDTSKPFAVLVRFEIPKYEKNSFNFILKQGEFEAKIDPDISGCATLDEQGGEYYLEEDIYSEGTCFIITARDITLDCQNKRIFFGNTEQESYGVYVSSENVTVKNCNFYKNSSVSLGDGAYFLESHGSSLINNTFNLNGDYIYGLGVSNSNSFEAINNSFSTNGSHSLAAYFEIGTDGASVSNNNFTTFSEDSAGILLEETHNSIFSFNEIKTFSWESHGFYSFISDNNSLYQNNITTYGANSIGSYLESSENLTISSNNFQTYESDAHAIYIYLSNNNTLSSNNISLLNSGVSFFLEEGDGNQFFNNQIYTYENEGNGVYLFYTNNSLISNNTIKTIGDYSHGFLFYNSNFNNITNTSINTTGVGSYGFYFVVASKENNLIRVNVWTKNLQSNSFYLQNPDSTISIYDSSFESVYEDEADIYFDYTEENPEDGEIKFVNVTYLNEYWNEEFVGSLEKFWYFDLIVNDGQNLPIQNVSVVIKNSTLALIVQTHTDASGQIERQILREYYKKGQNISEDNNYSLQLSSTDLASNSGFNLMDNIQMVAALSNNSYTVTQSFGGGGSSQDTKNNCSAKWVCTSWSSCNDGKAIRNCSNIQPLCSMGQKPKEQISCQKREDGLKKSLFDINLEILNDRIGYGLDSMLVKIFLLNIGKEGKTLANINYIIRNIEGQELLIVKEEVEVETQVEYLKRLNLSKLPVGEYYLEVNLTYLEQEEPAYSRARFEIVGAKKNSLYGLFFVIILLIAVSFIIILILRKRNQGKILNQIAKDLTYLEQKNDWDCYNPSFIRVYEEIKKNYEYLNLKNKKAISDRISALIKTKD